MTLKTRIDRLARRAGTGEPLRPTIAFYDSVLSGTVSEEEFARYGPSLRELFRDEVFEYRGDDGIRAGQEC